MSSQPVVRSNSSNNGDLPILINIKEVAVLSSISVRTIWRLVSTHEFPEPIRIGGSVRWARETVLVWLNSKINPSK